MKYFSEEVVAHLQLWMLEMDFLGCILGPRPLAFIEINIAHVIISLERAWTECVISTTILRKLREDQTLGIVQLITRTALYSVSEQT